MILVFDLDDTLYDEMTFVRSGFSKVSEYLEKKYRVPPRESFALMLNLLRQNGRGRVFNDLLSNYGLSQGNIKKCLSIYRSHEPAISLYEEADDCLNRFKGIPKYIVTDGNKLVQENKIKALNLGQRVKFSFITHRYGRIHSKPSPYCFFKICEKEKCLPQQVIYVADNPGKDFVGIKPFGFITVRVLTGQYRNVSAAKAYQADYSINSLSELTPGFVRSLARRI